MADRFGLTKATGISPTPDNRLRQQVEAAGMDPTMYSGDVPFPLPLSRLRDLLGEVLTMPKTTTSEGLSLPTRVRLSSLDPQRGIARLHGANMTGTPMSASTDELGTLVHSGVLQREAPASEGLSLEALVDRLKRVLARSSK